MSEIKMEISIPADNDGYILLQCPICGDYFKIKPRDYEDDDVLEIYCPCCGLCSDNYITEDVLELALAMTKNVATELIYNEMKKWELQFKGSGLTFKAGRKQKPEPENLISIGIEALIITNFFCCKRSAKIKPMLRISGCYCPFCGVKEYEIK